MPDLSGWPMDVRQVPGVLASGQILTSPLTFPAGTQLVESAANVLQQRNGANAQTLRIFQTFTDASNFRSFDIDLTTGGIANVKTNWAGTGTAWDLQFNNSLAIAGATGLITKVSGATAVGQGVAVIRANGRVTAQAAANASIS